MKRHAIKTCQCIHRIGGENIHKIHGKDCLGKAKSIQTSFGPEDTPISFLLLDLSSKSFLQNRDWKIQCQKTNVVFCLFVSSFSLYYFTILYNRFSHSQIQISLFLKSYKTNVFLILHSYHLRRMSGPTIPTHSRGCWDVARAHRLRGELALNIKDISRVNRSKRALLPECHPRINVKRKKGELKWLVLCSFFKWIFAIFKNSISLQTDRSSNSHYYNKKTDPLRNHITSSGPYGLNQVLKAGTSLPFPNPKLPPLHHENAFNVSIKLKRR